MYVQRLLRVEGVIVDLVQEITEAVYGIVSSSVQEEIAVNKHEGPNDTRLLPTAIEDESLPSDEQLKQVRSQKINLSSHIDNIIQVYQCQ